MKIRGRTNTCCFLKILTYLILGLTGGLGTLYGCTSTGQSKSDAHSIHDDNDMSSSHQASVLLNQDQSALYQNMLMQGNYSDAAILESFETFQPLQSHPTSLFRNISAPAINQRAPQIKPSPHKKSAHHLNANWHTDVGWTLVLDGNYRGAEAAYRQALRQNAKSATAYLGLGMALSLQGDRQKAISAYEKAVNLQPNYAAALVHLGYAYAEEETNGQNIAKARRLFQQASKLGDPFALLALLDLQGREKSV